MKAFSHTRPIRNEAGEIIGEKSAPVSRTGRKLTMEARDVYRILIRNEANKLSLEKARKTKAAKILRNQARRIKAADARITAAVRKDRET